MKTLILIISLLLLIENVQSQNIVPNGDFELYDSLPEYFGEWHTCQDWSNTSYGMSFPYGTPDYLHTSGFGDVALPNSIFATVNPFSGDAIMGICLVSDQPDEFREYLSTEFTTPMTIGTHYTISFWLTNGEYNQYCSNSTNHFGVQFSTILLAQNDYFPINGYPQLEIPGEFWSTDWQQITFDFIADSNYTFITFGNFFPDAQTITTHQVNGNAEGSYYFIDKVEVIPDEINSVQSEICFGDSITLNYSFNDSAYSWVNALSPSVILSNENHLTIAPEQSSTYILFGSEDTIQFLVEVINISPIDPLGPDINQCNSGAIELDPAIPGASYTWQNNSVSPTLTVDTTGIYWVDISIDNCTFRDSINIQLTHCDNSIGLEIPNVFTPNGDGVNDQLVPVLSYGISTMQTSILNRWGITVFETSDPLIHWNGDGHNDGVYFWTVHYTDSLNKEYTLHGFVTLER